MEFDILTLFPEMFETVFDASLLGKAREKGLVEIRIHHLRDWGKGKHDSVDDRPYGGGPGMVIKPEPVMEAVEAIQAERDPRPEPVLLTPRGQRLTQDQVESFAGSTRPLLLICGHYEGFDERIRTLLEPREISIGDFVLSGGEIPAMVLVDAISRLVPGVVGDPTSLEEESFTTGQLDFPQYTRPREYRGLDVPDVLLSGDHQAIEEWRLEQAENVTREHRPDLQDEEND
jgi:tRNA (guanine37-N1)-methyltransferase